MMAELLPIKVPLLNPNEPEALLVSIDVKEGAPIKEGDVLALIETTKSMGEVAAEADGFLVGIRYKEGETINAGDTLAYIGDAPDAQDPELSPWAAEEERKKDSTPVGLRITEPARKLALDAGLDLGSFPHGALITREMVQARLAPPEPIPAGEVPKGEKRLIIYGAGGHGQSLAALIRKAGIYEIVGFLDDGVPTGEAVLGMTVLGGSKKLTELKKEGICMAVNGVGGIGNLQSRLAVYASLSSAGFFTPTVIHPTAFIEDSAVIDDGVQVMPFSYLGTQVKVGYGCIINTGAIVSHDCELSPYVNLSPGATIAGGVRVGEGTLIGMRATVNLNVRVGARVRIGNGATVKADVPDGGVVPAGTIWPPRR
jgi:acetyltransferase EpsM